MMQMTIRTALVVSWVMVALIGIGAISEARAEAPTTFDSVRGDACEAIRAELMWAMIVWKNYPSLVEEGQPDHDAPKEKVQKAEQMLTGSARKNTILQESVVPLSAAYSNLNCE